MKPQPLRSILPDGALSTDEVLRVYDQIGRACAHAGLRFPDAEEVAQDIWEWLLRTNNVALAEEVPWLGAVAQNFIRRSWRRSHRHRFREGTPLDGTREPPTQQLIREVETNDVFDRISATLPQRERRLLILIRSGHTLAEAARMLKIPRGSRAYYGRRLVEFARRQMQLRNKTGGLGGRVVVRRPLSAVRCPPSDET